MSLCLGLLLLLAPVASSAGGDDGDGDAGGGASHDDAGAATGDGNGMQDGTALVSGDDVSFSALPDETTGLQRSQLDEIIRLRERQLERLKLEAEIREKQQELSGGTIELEDDSGGDGGSPTVNRSRGFGMPTGYRVREPRVLAVLPTDDGSGLTATLSHADGSTEEVREGHRVGQWGRVHRITTGGVVLTGGRAEAEGSGRLMWSPQLTPNSRSRLPNANGN